MMTAPKFEYNEAPDLALKSLKQHDTKRSCCSFWSWLFCLPTLGCSRYCDSCFGTSDSDQNRIARGYEFDCCRPVPIRMEPSVALDELRDALKDLRVDTRQDDVGSKEDQANLLASQQPLTVDEQVTKTLNVLRTALGTSIHTGYRRAVTEAINLIEAKQREITEHSRIHEQYLQAMSGNKQ